MLSTVVVLNLAMVGLGLAAQLVLAGNLHRIDGTFTGLHDRPMRPSTGHAANAQNILVLTTDRRATAPVTNQAVPAPRWIPGAVHVDSVMVLHLDGDRREAWALSMPLATPVGSASTDPTTLASVLDGTPSEVVGTLERMTDVRMDHLAVFNWSGFAALVDANGGIELHVASDRKGTRSDLDADQALAYIGQEGTGTLDGTRREQYFLRTLMDDSLHQELRKEPLRLYHVLSTFSRHLSVEAGWSSSAMRNLVISLRHLRSADIHYITPPGHANGRSMWRAVRADDLRSWSGLHPEAVLPDDVGVGPSA